MLAMEALEAVVIGVMASLIPVLDRQILRSSSICCFSLMRSFRYRPIIVLAMEALEAVMIGVMVISIALDR